MFEQAGEGANRPLYLGVPKNESAGAEQPALPAAAPQPKALLWAALASYPLAYLYVAGLFFAAPEHWRLWAPVFAAGYLLWGSWLARALHRPAGAESRFWAGCLLLQSAAMALYGVHAGPLGMWQVLVWHLCAIWWVLARTGLLAAGRSGLFTGLDALAGLFLLPWPNFLRRIAAVLGALAAGVRGLKHRGGRRAAEWGISILLAVLLCGFAWWQLAAADAHFAAIGSGLGRWLNRVLFNNTALVNFALRLVLSLPVGAWLYGLLAGALRRSAPPVSAAAFAAALRRAGTLPQAAGPAVMGGLCGVYALFFAMQALEFAAACGAPAPLAAPDAAAFAVAGFWELCRVMLLNFAVLLALRLLGRSGLPQGGAVRGLATVFCAFGAAFALLGGAKLWVYAALYGYTPRRVLAFWFAAVLLVWAVLAGVRLWRPIPAARLGVLALALSFSLLCCAPVERGIVRGNLARYAAGQDAELDTDVLSQCGFAEGNSGLADTRALLDTGWPVGRSYEEINALYSGALPWQPTEDTVALPVAGAGRTAVLELQFAAGRCTAAALTEGTR